MALRLSVVAVQPDNDKRRGGPVRFGKYELIDRISHGGMAEVFRAKTFGAAGFERTVAIKLLLPNMAMDQEFITMLIDEAKIAGQLSHANIAQIFDLGKVDDRYYIVQEYVNGRDVRSMLKSLARQGRRLGIDQCCYIILKVCEGLEYAHNKRDANGQPLNLVHRDVSPQNILVSLEGEVKLIDFGIAKAEGRATRTLAGLVKGKFAYMSPEQIRGLPVDRRSDVFACGIVLHELLTGKPLFRRKSEFETLKRARSGTIEPPSQLNPEVSPDLDRVVLRALARHVEDRFQSALELREALWDFARNAGYFYGRNDMAAWMLEELGEDADETGNYPSISYDDSLSLSDLSLSDAQATVVDISEDRDSLERSGELRAPAPEMSEVGAVDPFDDPDGPSIEIAPEALTSDERPTLLDPRPAVRFSGRITSVVDAADSGDLGPSPSPMGSNDFRRTMQAMGVPAPSASYPRASESLEAPTNPLAAAPGRSPSRASSLPPPDPGSQPGFAPLHDPGSQPSFAPPRDSGSQPGFAPPPPGSGPHPGFGPPPGSGASPRPSPPSYSPLDRSGAAPSPVNDPRSAPLMLPPKRSSGAGKLWLVLAILILLGAAAVTLTLVVTGA